MNKYGIRKRLMITVTATAAFVIMLVSIVACIVAVVNHQEQKHEAVYAKLDACKNLMEAWLGEKEAICQVMATEAINRDFASNSEECLAFLQACSQMDDDIFDCYVGFADKRYIFGSEYVAEGYDPTSRIWYKMAAPVDGPIVTNPYTDVQTGRMVITIATRFQENGVTIGVISIDVFLDTLSEYVSDLHVDENGYPLLLDSDGAIIVHENNAYLATVDASGNDVFTMLSDVTPGYSARIDASSLPEIKDYNNETVKYAETVLDSTGWKLGYMLNNSEYNSTYVKIILLFTGLTIFFGIYIAFLLNNLLNRALKPLNEVVLKSHDVAEGILDVKFDYSATDEVGAICRTIENNNLVVKNYIDDIARRLDGITHGNFDVHSNVEYHGDYAAIKRSLDNISRSLGNVFNGIDSASEAVSGGAEGVANGANQLAESVSTQTAVISEIVSDVENVSQMIANNVNRTDDARNIAHETASAVRSSNQQMQNLLGAMEEISNSSEEIKKIINTIEDIAFQTNILALNASIEAARAGMAGRGFAVVADEVRNLAGKSSEASVQTSKLIEHSVEAVNKGMRFADSASKSLSSVVDQTDEIDSIIVQINEQSHEQSTCMENVNQKVGVVADYVSSAAANAEESAAASQELNGQASQLKQMLSSFGL
ncbi:MAG: methyl-accepting chemotaxis protein [Oscillospiraceae bacterium]|nr:methyl-accepting chemotaxis protein [Oscillospiraceae bacterium]